MQAEDKHVTITQRDKQSGKKSLSVLSWRSGQKDKECQGNTRSLQNGTVAKRSKELSLLKPNQLRFEDTPHKIILKPQLHHLTKSSIFLLAVKFY